MLAIFGTVGLLHSPAFAISYFDTKNLSSNSGESADPNIAVTADNKVYVVWADKTPGNSEIILRTSNDGGETFSSKSKGHISNTPGESTNPQIVVSGKNVYIVWVDSTTGNGDIYFRASNDGGVTFGDVKNLSNKNIGASLEPYIIAVGDNAYIVWTDQTIGNGDIYFRKTSDGGDTFNSVINLSKNNGVSDQPEISTSGDGSNLYVAWRDNSADNREIFFKSSSDQGATFSSTKNLSGNSGSSGTPHISSGDSNDNVYVIWVDNTLGNNEILFKKSTDEAKSFDNTINLSKTPDASFSHQLAASGDKVYVIWRDTPREVFLKLSNDGGSTFEDSVNLSNDETDSGWPRIVADGDHVFAIWRAGPLPSLSKEVYARASDDGGKTFDPVDNLSNNSGNSGPPQAAASGGNLYVVWSDTTTGNGDIYIKKGS